MPDIPNLPGVPPLSSYAPSGSDVFTLLASDVLAAAVSFLFGPVYGIFLDHLPLPVLAADNYVHFEHKQNFEIATYPVEASTNLFGIGQSGSFVSYDKVRLPAEIKVRVSTGGTIFDRQALLSTLDLVMPTTGLYDVVTPEHVYFNYCFIHREMVREADHGAGLIAVDITLMEVLQTATALFQSTQSAGIAGALNTGSVSTSADTFGASLEAIH